MHIYHVWVIVYVLLIRQPSHRGYITGFLVHYSDVIMGAIASRITSLTIVCTIVYSGADQRKQQSSASLAFVRGRGIHRGPVNSPHKRPVTRKCLRLMTSSWTISIEYIHCGFALLSFVVVTLPIQLDSCNSLSLEQSCDCPSASEVKIDHYQTTSQYNIARTMCIFREKYCKLYAQDTPLLLHERYTNISFIGIRRIWICCQL